MSICIGCIWFREVTGVPSYIFPDFWSCKLLSISLVTTMYILYRFTIDNDNNDNTLDFRSNKHHL